MNVAHHLLHRFIKALHNIGSKHYCYLCLTFLSISWQAFQLNFGAFILKTLS